VRLLYWDAEEPWRDVLATSAELAEEGYWI
jgi:hypothetical protein